MKFARCVIVVLALALVAAASGFAPRRIGDRLQIALPLAGLGCALATGQAGGYLLRFTGLELALYSSKETLGDAAINTRPDGSLHGFPSGHTAAATFGAAALASTCLRASPSASAAVYLASGFTGTSRVLAERHTPLQVFAGALLGWLIQVLPFAGLRRLRRVRRRALQG